MPAFLLLFLFVRVHVANYLVKNDFRYTSQFYGGMGIVLVSVSYNLKDCGTVLFFSWSLHLFPFRMCLHLLLLSCWFSFLTCYCHQSGWSLGSSTCQCVSQCITSWRFLCTEGGRVIISSQNFLLYLHSAPTLLIMAQGSQYLKVVMKVEKSKCSVWWDVM